MSLPKTTDMFFFDLPPPVAVALIGVICIMHSLFHLPHCLMYRRLVILTAFWSLVGVGLIFAAIMEYETLYLTWVWYSCVYVPLMLVIMVVQLTAYIFELDLKPWRVVLAIVAVLFYMFMLYSVAYVYELHSVFHLPHCLMYHRLGVLTGVWSVLGVGLIFGAIMEYEFFYAMFVWYSCVYVLVMLTTMCIKLATSIFELDFKPWRVFLAIVAVLFYIFMLYSVAYVYEVKSNLFSKPSTPCPTLQPTEKSATEASNSSSPNPPASPKS